MPSPPVPPLHIVRRRISADVDQFVTADQETGVVEADPAPAPHTRSGRKRKAQAGVLYNVHDARRAEADVNALLLAISQYRAPAGPHGELQQVGIDMDRLTSKARTIGLAQLLFAKGIITEAEMQTAMQRAMCDELQAITAMLEADERMVRPGKVQVVRGPQIVTARR